jgi:peptidoglycan/LPS O-acetylase OafA/YrhL
VTPLEAPPRRYEGLDALRAGAMLLGLAYHATYAYVPDVGPWYPVVDPSSSPFFSSLAGALHAFRMHVFFALAGFLSHLLLEHRGVVGFLKDRARRLLAPLAVALPLTWLADLGARTLSDRAGLMDSRYALGTAVRFVPLHLWFLEYLFLFCVAAAVLWRLRLELPARLLRWALGFPEGLVLLAVPTGAVLATGELKPDTSFLPQLSAVVVMGLFYSFGFVLWSVRDAVGVLARRGVWMAPAGLVLASWLYTRPLQWEPVGWALSAVVAWLVTLGSLAAALRVKVAAGPVVRLLVDASYWIYLVHDPLVMVVQVLVARVPWGPGPKYLMVVASVTCLALGTYAFLVRGSFLRSYLAAGRVPIKAA